MAAAVGGGGLVRLEEMDRDERERIG